VKKTTLPLLLYAIAGLTLALGQDSAGSPKPPALHRAPAMSSWTVTYAYAEEKVPPGTPAPGYLANSVRTLTVTKTGKTYHEETTLISGKKRDKWVLNNLQLESVVDSPSIIPIPPSTPQEPQPDYSDYSHTDFKGLEWVTMSNYTGVKSSEGKPAYEFEIEHGGQKVSALLDVTSQLPLSSTEGGTTCTYVFNSPPTSPLVLPPNFQSVLDAYKRGMEGLKFHPSPP